MDSEALPDSQNAQACRRGLTHLDDIFDEIYADNGRPPIPPERLVRASLLQVISSIRSERQLMERMDYNLMFSWLFGLSVDRLAWNPSTFSNNRNRSAGSNFRGEQRSDNTHASRTDPDALLASKCHDYTGHTLMEHRNGLLIDAELTQATGTAEQDTAFEMAIGLKAGATVGAEKAYDTRDFVTNLRGLRITPHVAQNLERSGASAIDARTTRHAGYALSKRARKRVEESFGWAKKIGGLRQTKFRGLEWDRQDFLRVMAAYNLIRLRNLLPEPAW